MKKAKKSNRPDNIIKAIREITNNLPNLDLYPLKQDVIDFMSGECVRIFGSLN